MSSERPTSEVLEWDAEPAEVRFENGQLIQIERGDMILAETDPSGATRFIEKLRGQA